jgi:3-oxoacyl-[acyl-carrier-protein] synthase-3
MNSARMLGCGLSVPEKIYPNTWFDAIFDKPVGPWLEENLGIRQRYWCSETENVLDLAEQAALSALSNAGIKAGDLDLIILATDTPAVVSPATSAALQHRLGAKQAATFDINNACAGFLNGLDIGAKFIQQDEDFDKVMIIGAYAVSKFLDTTDKKTATIFGDGAGAVILGKDATHKGYLGSRFLTDGSYFNYMGIYESHLEAREKFPEDLNSGTWVRLIRELSQKIRIPVSEISHFFFTQINIQSIYTTLQTLGCSVGLSHNIMDRYAYTGAACLPMAFADAWQQEKFTPGDILVFVGSGAGAAFGATAFVWS